MFFVIPKQESFSYNDSENELVSGLLLVNLRCLIGLKQFQLC